MEILRPIDIEEEIRLALKDYLTVYVRPLPANFTVPSILVTQAGGETLNTIDTFRVSIDSRAETEEEALSLIRTAQGILEAQACSQFGNLRSVKFQLSSPTRDPVRPELCLRTLPCEITVHREKHTIT